MHIRMDSIYYDEIVEPLRQRGRADLIAAIDDRKREWARYKRWHEGTGLRGRVKRLLGVR